MHRTAPLVYAMWRPKIFRKWCPLGNECKKKSAQLCKEVTAERCVERLMSHTTGSPSHELDRTSVQEVVNQAEISQEWVEDEIVPEVVQDMPVAKRSRMSNTPPASVASAVTLSNFVCARSRLP